MNIPKIKEIQIANNYKLLVTFTNNEKRKYDVTPLLKLEMFSPLKNFSFFKKIKIESGGYAISWNENIDISEHELWKNGTPI